MRSYSTIVLLAVGLDATALSDLGLVGHWTLDDIGAEANKVGAEGSGVRWPEVSMPPAREGEAEIIQADTVEETAAILVEKLLAEKVI